MMCGAPRPGRRIGSALQTLLAPHHRCGASSVPGLEHVRRVDGELAAVYQQGPNLIGRLGRALIIAGHRAFV